MGRKSRNENLNQLTIGAVVEWTTRGARKVGTIVGIVPSGANPKEWAVTQGLRGRCDVTTMLAGCGPRQHVTYLVEVPGSTARSKPVIYRPLVSALRVAPGQQAQAPPPQAAAPKAPKQAQAVPVTQTVVEQITPTKPLVNHIGIAIDVSPSMFQSCIMDAATRALNQQVSTIKAEADRTGQVTDISVYSFSTQVQTIQFRTPAGQTRSQFGPFRNVGDGTALYDAIGRVLDDLLSSPDANDPNVSFLAIVPTDGEECTSRDPRYIDQQINPWFTGVTHATPGKLRALIQRFHATGRGTLVLLVPPGAKPALVARLGVPEGNVQEWTQSDAGVRQAAAATAQGTQTYFSARAAGATKLDTFFEVDLSKLTAQDVKKKLRDVSANLKTKKVNRAGREIGEFMEEWTKRPYLPGSGYYPFGLRKEELKKGRAIVIRRRGETTFYGGPGVRDILGIPTDRDVKIGPKNLADYEVWVQSASDNRKLVADTTILWDMAFTGGVAPTWEHTSNGSGQLVGAR